MLVGFEPPPHHVACSLEGIGRECAEVKHANLFNSWRDWLFFERAQVLVVLKGSLLRFRADSPTFNRALCVWMTFWFLHTHTQTLTRQTWPSAKWRMPPGPVSVYSTTSSARDLEVRYLILHRPTPQGFGTKNMKCVIENKLILLTKYKYSSIQQMYKNKAFAELTNATCQLCYI